MADNKGNQVLEFSINGRLLRKIESHKVDKVSLENFYEEIAIIQQSQYTCNMDKGMMDLALYTCISLNRITSMAKDQGRL